MKSTASEPGLSKNTIDLENSFFIIIIIIIIIILLYYYYYYWLS